MPRLAAPAITRRSLMMGAAAMPFVPRRSMAAADMMGPSMSRFDRFTLGEFEVTTLLTGTNTVEIPHNDFGLNVSDEEFKAVSDAAGIPADKSQYFFIPTLVNTGDALILFDTGATPIALVKAIEQAGYWVEDVDKVVITHMHGDHIGGLAAEDGPTFPNASYVTGNMEYDAWDGTGNEAFDTLVLPLASQMSFVSGGMDVTPGITAIEAFGHTLGHMTYMIESAGEQLFLGADFAAHHVWSLAHPDWEVSFDEDHDAAAKTRKSILDMLATDRIPFVGYHMPWPGVGRVERTSDGGYRYAPDVYQRLL